MTAIIFKEKSHELKELLHRAMGIAEQMCESEMGERSGYGMRDGYGERDYPPEYPMGERWEAYGDRRGVRGTGRYSRY